MNGCEQNGMMGEKEYCCTLMDVLSQGKFANLPYKVSNYELSINGTYYADRRNIGNAAKT